MDETSKFGQQYLATAVHTDNRETLILSLNEMANKSAQSKLAIFKEKLADLEAVKEKLTQWLDVTASDPIDFIAGESMPFDWSLLHNDAVYRLLIEPSPEYDAAAERSQALKEAAKAKLQQKQEKRCTQLLQAAKSLKKITAGISADGLWQSAESSKASKTTGGEARKCRFAVKYKEKVALIRKQCADLQEIAAEYGKKYVRVSIL
uniref:Uncharacterized protein n=1 Tax=Plectus sambesii TaxID=2011161 RepID=A0A914WGY0_9BILA